MDNTAVEDSIDHLVALDRAHDARAPRLQRIADRVTAGLGNPRAVAVILVLVVVWMIGNYAARLLGVRAFEEFPFPDLAFIATVAAFLVALLIMVTQRHADALADKRAQLTLQMALLNERKIAKVIALLEEQRRDNPLLPSRPDHQALAMAQPSDVQATLDRLDGSRDGDG
jgi:uncharacterized membrane protein